MKKYDAYYHKGNIWVYADINKKLWNLGYYGEDPEKNSLIIFLLKEEAIWLVYNGILNIVDLDTNEFMNIDEIFKIIEEGQMDTINTYIHCRQEGWIIKSGSLYGVDFLLYNDNPENTHASYALSSLSKLKKMNWIQILGINRTIENANKIFCINHGDEIINIQRWLPNSYYKEQITQL